jgi:hypothetical protein
VKHGIIILAVLALNGCVSTPDTYRPPIERKPLLDGHRTDLREFIAMSDPEAADHIMNGISDTVESGAWRWTEERFTLMFAVPDTTGWKLAMEFTIPGETFAQTGPFHITYSVNGRALDKVQYDSPGEKRFEKLVPAERLRKRAENIVMAELDKAYIAEADQKKLGVILIRAGFVR